MRRPPLPFAPTRRGRALLVALVLLSACGDDVSTLLRPDTGGPSNTVLSDDARSFMLGFGAVAALAEFQKAHDLRVLNPLRLLSLRDHALTYAFGANGACTPTQSSTADANQNGVPDDATLTFTPQNCVLLQNGVPFPVTGTVRAQDLGDLFGLRLTFNDVRLTQTRGDSTTTIALNGTSEVRLVADRLTTVNRVTSSLTAAQPGGSLTLVFANDFTTEFRPNTGALSRAAPVPAGRFTMTGSYQFRVQRTGAVPPPAGLGLGDYTVVLATPAPLLYNGSCPASQNFFSGGTFRLTITGVAGSTVDADWPSCSTTTPTPKR